MQPRVESLESRQHLSVSARFDAEKSYLRIIGTDASETIEVFSVSSATTGNSTIYSVQVRVDGRIILQDVPTDIKRIIIYGFDGNDQISVSSEFVTSEFHPLGSDIFERKTRVIACSIEGGGGNDTINSGNANDTILGGKGKDQIFSNAGDDRISGGAAADRMNAGAGNDLIRGNGGNDRIDGADGEDTLFGNDGNDSLSGQNGQDTLWGGNGDDLLAGGLAGDQHFGGAGIDTADYSGRTENVRIELAGAVPDTFRAIPGLDDQPYPRNRLLFDDGRYAYNEDLTKFIPPQRDDDWFGCGRLEGDGIIEVENARGGDGDDVILGNENSNHLEGGDGDDSIFAGAGRDTVLGNDGDDSIFTVDTRDGSPIVIDDPGDRDFQPNVDRIDGGPGEDFARFDGRDSSSVRSIRFRVQLPFLFS